MYAAALKLLILGAFFLDIIIPFRSGGPAIDWLLFLFSTVLLAVGIGIVESCMARFRLVRVPQMLLAAGVLSSFALLLVLR